ncbi:BolA family protein [Parvularcula dongshanensis]|uniref:BolA protein n=1 Tax=Parvularcula dongshanensis TaxID=1173995 RepID=A0A840I3K1_9PROT|nr:BolA family protein [Parvularcula dongshanensis]MBB4659357.1 BolA protein [Parvularcula dongshanensis]
MSVAATIETKLDAAFRPLELQIVDQSHLHAGHAAAPEGGESHFRVRVVSELFEGVSRIERQRKVNAALRDELAGPVHALSIEALAPSEAR